MSLAALRCNFALPLGILLILAFQGLFDTAPTLFCVASASASLSAAHKAHSKYCRCKDCSGARNLKKCCCVKAKTGADATAFAAACDTPKDTLQASEQSPRALTSSVAASPLPPLTAPVETPFPRQFDAHGSAPEPSPLPPRSL